MELETLAPRVSLYSASQPEKGNRSPDHRALRNDEFWKSLPGYAGINSDEFQTHIFQTRNSVTNVRQLRDTLKDRVPESFYEDVVEGIKHAPMALRISPYLLGLIDWDEPYLDPIRTQFLPVASQQLPNHPELRLDSLHEQKDSPVPGLIHRYPDKALFLPIDSCPVYCRFCTRSYAIGSDTDTVEKLKLSARAQRWDNTFTYIASRPELEDIVISGGDTYNLKPEHIQMIGERLLRMPNIRRIRYATKGLAVLPQKIITDHAWLDALTRVVELGRQMHKDVVVHTHFNHPNEITTVTERAMGKMTERGITVRCQTVLQRGVNDNSETMQLLVRRLSYINIHPYYVYFHDMVPGVEDLRTSLEAGLNIEKHVRGHTAGFNTPSFVVDTMGGGGKRDAHSFEHYDRETGIAVYTSPSVKPGVKFLYFDPLSTLDKTQQVRWQIPDERRLMIDTALNSTGGW
ncbi:MAG: L-lysine 2,3-aminomutase [Verrucomicrobiales bacterium]|nr:L-lysine 2,3-aminomutase [Verrucomicrobiales bacterium]MDB6130681.1 L-lysine 2,3-aminomutase [Verrucomicrobiales bacterium]